MKPARWLVFLSAFFVIHIPAILNDHNNTNAYLLLTHSLLRGHLYLPTSGFSYFTKINYGDLILFHGKYYLPYPPIPALLIVPFTLLSGGAGTNSVLICVLLTGFNIFLLYHILKRLNIDAGYIPWLIYGFFFGTGYWYSLLTSHHVYGFAQIVAVTFILLLLHELLGKKRVLLLATYLGLAFLCRQMTIFFSFLVLGYLYHQFYVIYSDIPRRKRNIFYKKAFLFLLSLTPFLGILLLYNFARFGNPFDNGYEYIRFLGVLKERVDEYGVFNIHYLLYNIYSLLIKGFNIEFTGNGLLHIKDMDLFGTSLLSASPFLICALKTGWSKSLRISSWLTISAILISLLFYHNNGFEQVNAYRFSLDFLPMLIILTALGARNLPRWLFLGMIIYSILLNVLAQGIHFLYHTI